MSDKIRVLIVDDSPLMRSAIQQILEGDEDIEVVGWAKDGREGVEKAALLKPSVITMDLRMPIMSGLDAIEEIMQENPVPVIVVSSMDISVIIKALGIGAMDFVAVTQDVAQIAKDLVEKIKIASRVKPIRRFKLKPFVCPRPQPATKLKLCKVVAVGVSTGGPQALQVLLSKIPPGLSCGFVIVQHMSKGFIGGLAEWLGSATCLDVRIAKQGDSIKPGVAFLAPDDFHLRIGADGRIQLSEDTKKEMLHTPSIDIMMKSVADSFGKEAIGVIMTGMGRDGVEGIKAIKKAGGFTIAQDEASSVVFGMNKAAIEERCIDEVAALDDLAIEVAAACACER